MNNSIRNGEFSSFYCKTTTSFINQSHISIKYQIGWNQGNLWHQNHVEKMLSKIFLQEFKERKEHSLEYVLGMHHSNHMIYDRNNLSCSFWYIWSCHKYLDFIVRVTGTSDQHSSQNWKCCNFELRIELTSHLNFCKNQGLLSSYQKEMNWHHASFHSWSV